MIRLTGRAALAVLVLAIAATHALGAQTRSRPAARERASAAGSVDPVSVRAEYASALLQARRYREAAAEYRGLLQIQPANFDWRLNYARALAWGGSHREAEIELKGLSARAPRSAIVEQLLRSVRASIEPSSREAGAWVAERPNYLPYRLALARAYVRERRPRSAFAHYDLVVARDLSAAVLAEAADARAAGGDRRGAVGLYRRAVEHAPSDVTLRRSYARALAANREFAAAVEQYTLLAEEGPDPRLLMERAEARRESGDEAGAERDLQASLDVRPTPGAYTALGDLYRWRGQFRRARATYQQAFELRPGDRRVASRLAQVAREMRPGFGYASSITEEAGVTLDGRTVVDNTGFAFAAAGGRVGYALGAGTVLGVGVEPRFIYDGSPGGAAPGGPESVRRIVGVGASLGLAQTYRREDVEARVVGRGGVAGHSAGSAMPLLAGSTVVTYRGAWSLSIEGTEGPAYEQLMALAVTDDPLLLPVGAAAALLRARTFAVGAAAPFGITDVGAEYESMSLSDGNTRTAVQASVRVPLAGGLSLLYAGGSVTFSQRSTLYWDPSQYFTHALGLELGVRRDDGVAFTARVLPGFGRAVEGLTSGGPTRAGAGAQDLGRFVGHVAGGADLSVRRRHWETALSSGFGTGRAGGYRRFDGSVRVRYTP